MARQRLSQTGGFRWSDGLTRTFTRDASRPWPILALNGTSVEKGKRIITSNVRFATEDHLAGVNISGGIHRYDGLDIMEADIPISTAVTMSARFPIVSTAGGMRDGKGQLIGRVIDGGLFENFGAVLADESIRYLVERIREAQRTERPVVPIAILISSDPSLDRIELRPGTPKQGVLPDCLPVGPKPLPHPGNDWPECPVDAASYATLMVDPIKALYDGRTARGELAATALRDRIEGSRIMIRDRLVARLRAGTDQTIQAATDTVQARIGLDDHTDFFHFRQCRVPDAKSPTMSWHDSGTAWHSMRRMLASILNRTAPLPIRAATSSSSSVSACVSPACRGAPRMTPPVRNGAVRPAGLSPRAGAANRCWGTRGLIVGTSHKAWRGTARSLHTAERRRSRQP